MTDFIAEYWLGALFGVTTSIMGYVLRKLNHKINEQESIKLGVQALLKDRIIEKYERVMDEGYCPVYLRDSIMAMAKEYYNLGGNGIVPSLIDKIQYLPTSPPDHEVEGD